MIRIDIPMPESCADCPMNYDFIWCQALDRDDPHFDEWGTGAFDFTKKPDYCPLHEELCANCPLQPIRPTWQQSKAYCGQCGKRIPMKINAFFCHKCGREINWLP